MLSENIAAVRSFNRFYTGIIGLLDRYILHSHYTLPEARILYELYHRSQLQATDLINLLDIDKGYLSRQLLHFEKKKLLTRSRSAEDGRVMFISLTSKGRQEFEDLNAASEAQIRDLLTQLPEDQQDLLINHMNAITKILRGLSQQK